MRFLRAAMLCPVLMIFGGMLSYTGSKPLSPPPAALAPALYETARLLESFGELEHATELIFHPLAEPYDQDSGPASLRQFRARLLVKQGLYLRADSILAGSRSPLSRDDYFLHMLVRARLNFLGDSCARAHMLISSIDSISSALFNDYRAMLKMQILSALGENDLAAEIGDQVWRKGIPSPLSPGFEQSLLEALECEKRYQPALRVIRTLRDRYGNDEIMFPFIGREMQIYIATGDSVRSFQLALEIAGNHGTRPIALEFSRIARSMYEPGRIGTDTLLTFCSVFLNHGETDAAAEILNCVQERRTNHYNREHTRYLRARLLFLQRQFSTAIALLESKFDDPQLSKHSLLLTARTYRRMKQYQQAARTYVSYGKAYPGADLARESLYVAANLYERIAMPIEANQVFTYLASHYPNQYHGRLASLYLAREAMNSLEYGESISILKRVLDHSGGPQEDVLYYLALSYQRAGDDENFSKTARRLQSLDPNSFYLNPEIAADYELPELASRGRIQLAGADGLLELLKRIQAMRREAYAQIESAAGLPDVHRTDWLENEHYRRGVVFLDAGLADWGIPELEIVYNDLRSNAGALLAMGRLFERHCLAWHSVKMFARLQSVLRSNNCITARGTFDVFLYPIPFPTAVLEQCISYKLPPHFAYAMIREESRFDAGAVSRAGALGLMQIMPETGRDIAQDLGYPMRTTKILLNPEINIAFGMKYAARLLEQSGGNHYMMLCAYNAGMGNAERWFTQATKELSIQEQVDTIDYKETRAYVQRIIESSQRYAAFFGRRRAF